MPMERPTWVVSARCTRGETRLLVTDRGSDVLRARLPFEPGHPRAMVTLCEGLALWNGAPLSVVVSADDDARDRFDAIFYGGGLVEPQSPLVRLEHRLHGSGARLRLRRRELGDVGIWHEDGEP